MQLNPKSKTVLPKRPQILYLLQGKGNGLFLKTQGYFTNFTTEGHES